MAFTRGLAFAASIAVITATALSAADHVRLVNEGSPGPLYECGAATCAPAQTDDPSRQNLGQMAFYVLPDGCVALASVVLRPEIAAIDVACGLSGDARRYRCQAGSCPPLDPAAGDTGGIARPIPLPTDCGGRIHELIVIGSTTDAPLAVVACDASSGPAGEM